jgi:hypothetical protein
MDTLEKFPLVEYVAKHWAGHALYEGVERYAEGLKQLFGARKPHIAVWLWIYNLVHTPFNLPYT